MKVAHKLGFLDSEWNSVNLFEVRTYSNMARCGAFHLTSMSTVSQGQKRVAAFVLEPCRRYGQQVVLLDGLDRFFDASKRFVQRLLQLSTSDSR